MIKLDIKEVDSWGKSNDILSEVFLGIEKLPFKSQKDQNRFQQSKKELLLLLRSKHHLEEANLAIIELVTMYYNENSGFPKDQTRKAHYAFLSYISTLIISCFNPSDYRDGQAPLQFFKDSFKDNPIYLEIKEIRDKRFAHQDKEHPVHKDVFRWCFEKNEDFFIPTKPSYVFENLNSLHREQLANWSKFVNQLIIEIDQRVKIMTSETNLLLEKIIVKE